MAKDTDIKNPQISSVVAKEDNGNIQITFSIPYSIIESNQNIALNNLAKDVEVPGFRKGKAPIAEAIKKIPQETVIEKTLGQILPEALGEAIKKNNIKPVIYPKFELIKAEPQETWQVRAVTCELPEFSLGNYKKELTDKAKVDTIWTPKKGQEKDEPKKEPTKEEKEAQVVKILLDSVKVDIPELLVTEEVNARLSSLLGRIEKLGLNLDSYLSSIGKTPQTLRSEYEVQSKNTIALELILEKIAKEEKIEINENEIDEAIKASGGSDQLSEKLNTPEQRRMIAAILRKRQALDSLITLI